MMDVVLQPRTAKIGDLVEACARKEITFSCLCEQVAAMGYKTTSLYEMVRAAEADKEKPQLSDTN